MLHLPSTPPSLDQILEDAGLKTGGATSRGYSFWGAFQICPYDARVIELAGRGFQAEVTSPLVVGTLTHEGLAHWYQTYDRDAALAPIELVGQWAERELRGEFPEFASMVYDAAHEAHRLVSGSFNRPTLSEEIHDINDLGNPLYEFPRAMVRAVELPVEYDGLFRYSGRIDLVLESRDESGEPCAVIVDHKTLFRHSDSWTEAFWIDLQFLGLPFLWNEVMVPTGYPPCRYIVANGLVKDPKEVRDRFVREVYPVRQQRIVAWKSQMKATWDEYNWHLARERALDAAGEPYDIRDAWQQRYASCHSRRYGKANVSYLPKFTGEFLPDGGRCHRFAYCLHDNTLEQVVPKPRSRDIPESIAGVERCRPELCMRPIGTASSPNISEDGRAIDGFPPRSMLDAPWLDADCLGCIGGPPGAANTTAANADAIVGLHNDNDWDQCVKSMVCQPDNVIDPGIQLTTADTPPVASATPTANAEGPKEPAVPIPEEPGSVSLYKYPLPNSSSEILYLENIASEGIPLESFRGFHTVYVNGSIVWTTDQVTPDGKVWVRLPGIPDTIPYDPDVIAYLAEPAYKTTEASLASTPSEPAEERAEPVEPALVVEASQPSLPASPASLVGPERPPLGAELATPTRLGIQVGEAPLPGVGLLPVVYIGSVSKGGSALTPNMTAVLRERENTNVYGAALVGHKLQSRKLVLVTMLNGDLVIYKKSEIGNAVWSSIEAEVKKVGGGFCE